MATLNDSFQADLDELSDNEDDLLEEEDADAEHMEEDVDGDLADIESLKYDNLDSVSKLQKTQRYTDIMQKVENALEKGSESSNLGIVLEDNPEYQLIVDCNALSVDIENEIVIIHNFIRDKYRLKFPELESLVHHPVDYARVVQKIGNEMDLTLVDLEGLLPSAIIMVVSFTASTTSGKPLPEDVLHKTIDACDRALALDSAKKKVLDFVESRMGYIAPNLSAIVGSAVAAKLMGTAGGLSALAKMPACNVQLLGAKRKNLAGFSMATSQFRVGYLEQTEIFQSTPPSLRMRACRLLASKSTLAARVDSTRGNPTGKTGRTFRAEIHKKIEKWQEPPPAKQPKPLPVPDSEPKKKRGGRRLRKMKERYAITDMRKLANRIQFGVPEESSLGDGLGEGYGILGQAGNGKLRVSIGQSKLAAKVAKKFKEKRFGSSGATSRRTSSLAFTPVQSWLDRVETSKTNRSSEPAGPDTSASKHIAGSKTYSAHYHSMRANQGTDPSLWDLYFHTHRRPDGSFVDERSKLVHQSMEALRDESLTPLDDGTIPDQLSSEEVNSTFKNVVGGRKNGRMYGCGSMASTIYSNEMAPRPRERGSRSSQNSQSIREMVEQQNKVIEFLRVDLQALHRREELLHSRLSSVEDQIRLLVSGMPQAPPMHRHTQFYDRRLHGRGTFSRGRSISRHDPHVASSSSGDRLAGFSRPNVRDNVLLDASSYHRTSPLPHRFSQQWVGPSQDFGVHDDDDDDDDEGGDDDGAYDDDETQTL